MYDFPYHMLYLLYCFSMVSCRAYFHGLADASGESVPPYEEGRIMRCIRNLLGMFYILGALAYLANPDWMFWSHLSDLPSPLRWLGMTGLLLSLLLYRWTHTSLGKNFTDTVFVRGKSVLVTTGPYRLVRHPMYVCGILAGAGTGLGLANWFLGLTGLLLMAVVMIWRTPIEEAKLIKRHGELYRDYMKTTGKYFPRWR